eukprot:TRINITY_DN5893_c0_g1_i2.p1 TRINITY_DN5893_c0_g1~~TRINITY_DN5893_c0_g1_i2.p1  ORF type:complete len:465 (+),score=82.17 TRINITY_DN5893_c0_g1_i2:68-1462(+)
MSVRALRIFLCAGEPSGDLIGAKLMYALKRLAKKEISFHGVGGEHMIRAGMNTLFPMDDLSVMGFVEVLPHLPKLQYRLWQTEQHIRETQPDVVIGIDSKGFNLRLLRQAFRSKALPNHCKRVLYVSPSFWAFSQEVASRQAIALKTSVDHVLCLLPFESSYLQTHGVNATFIGYPVMDELFYGAQDGKSRINGDEPNSLQSFVSNLQDIDINTLLSRFPLCAKPRLLDPSGISVPSCRVGLFPGSRKGEIDRHLPIFLDACKLLDRQTSKNISPIIVTNHHTKDYVTKHQSLANSNVQVASAGPLKGPILENLDLAIAASGSVVTELLLHNIPSVVAYSANWITEKIIRSRVKIAHASIPNLLANHQIVPEHLFGDCKANNIASSIRSLMNESSWQDRTRDMKKRVVPFLCATTDGSFRLPMSLHDIQDVQNNPSLLKELEMKSFSAPSVKAAQAILCLVGGV